MNKFNWPCLFKKHKFIGEKFFLEEFKCPSAYSSNAVPLQPPKIAFDVIFISYPPLSLKNTLKISYYSPLA